MTQAEYKRAIRMVKNYRAAQPETQRRKLDEAARNVALHALGQLPPPHILDRDVSGPICQRRRPDNNQTDILTQTEYDAVSVHLAIEGDNERAIVLKAKLYPYPNAIQLYHQDPGKPNQHVRFMDFLSKLLGL